MKNHLFTLLATVTLASGTLMPPQAPPEGRADIEPPYNASAAPPCGTDDTIPLTRVGVTSQYSRWSTIKFWIHPYRFTDYERLLINYAAHELMGVVNCIGWFIYAKYADPKGDYVYIDRQDPTACYSLIGKQGGGQIMVLGSQCMQKGTIMHEMMHALGVHHEQKSPNRDYYINVYEGNIIPRFRDQFRILSQYEVSPYGQAYNTRSVMHYSSDAFSVNGYWTMTDKFGRAVGTQGVLQESDRAKLRAMYGC